MNSVVGQDEFRKEGSDNQDESYFSNKGGEKFDNQSNIFDFDAELKINENLRQEHPKENFFEGKNEFQA